MEIGGYKDFKSQLYKRMAEAYYKFVLSLEDDIVLGRGLQEGKNKFLSNAYIKSIKQKGRKNKYIEANKYLTSHFISKKALKLMKDNNFEWSKMKNQLRFEHIIPKEEYQSKMYKNIKNQKMTVKDVEEMLNKYWQIATITKEENGNIILGKKMPKGWVYSDEPENIRIRYSAQYNKNGEKIEIEENTYLENLFIEL